MKVLSRFSSLTKSAAALFLVVGLHAQSAFATLNVYSTTAETTDPSPAILVGADSFTVPVLLWSKEFTCPFNTAPTCKLGSIVINGFTRYGSSSLTKSGLELQLKIEQQAAPGSTTWNTIQPAPGQPNLSIGTSGTASTFSGSYQLSFQSGSVGAGPSDLDIKQGRKVRLSVFGRAKSFGSFSYPSVTRIVHQLGYTAETTDAQFAPGTPTGSFSASGSTYKPNFVGATRSNNSTLPMAQVRNFFFKEYRVVTGSNGVKQPVFVRTVYLRLDETKTTSASTIASDSYPFVSPGNYYAEVGVTDLAGRRTSTTLRSPSSGSAPYKTYAAPVLSYNNCVAPQGTNRTQTVLTDPTMTIDGAPVTAGSPAAGAYQGMNVYVNHTSGQFFSFQYTTAWSNTNKLFWVTLLYGSQTVSFCAVDVNGAEGLCAVTKPTVIGQIPDGTGFITTCVSGGF